MASGGDCDTTPGTPSTTITMRSTCEQGSSPTPGGTRQGGMVRGQGWRPATALLHVCENVCSDPILETMPSALIGVRRMHSFIIGGPVKDIALGELYEALTSTIDLLHTTTEVISDTRTSARHRRK
jgi:hypothetical protein